MAVRPVTRARKKPLPARSVWLLAAAAAVPLLVMAARMTASPGAWGLGPGTPFEWLRAAGDTLNHTLSFSALPAGERERILYLLFVPWFAMVVTLVRLTLGIPVLGFRSILIAVGFHAAGVFPSLFLIAAVVATVLLVRPWLKRVRLPLYARVAVILCMVAVTMVGAILLSIATDSDALWGVVYFPVIVLGMLAEGTARTIANHTPLAAAWRVASTVALGFVLSLAARIPLLRETLLQFPELLVLQVVAIILISEFLDLRLLQGWNSRISGMTGLQSSARHGRFRVAVVRNRDTSRVLAQFGNAASRQAAQRSIQPVVDALRAAGHVAKVVEGDSSLLRTLRDFMPPLPRSGDPSGIALLVGPGIQGHARPLHVPALLEMLGVPYAGAGPLGQAAMTDRVLTHALLAQAGIPAPRFRIVERAQDSIVGLRYPVAVRPRHEPRARPRVAADANELQAALRRVLRRYRQQAVVEESLEGRHIAAAVIGNASAEVLPLVEVHPQTGRPAGPARLEAAVAERVRATALRAFRACSARDYARADCCVAIDGQIYVTGIDTENVFTRHGAFRTAAELAGWSFADLMRRIVDTARRRYRPRGTRQRRSAARQNPVQHGGIGGRLVEPQPLHAREAQGES